MNQKALARGSTDHSSDIFGRPKNYTLPTSAVDGQHGRTAPIRRQTFARTYFPLMFLLCRTGYRLQLAILPPVVLLDRIILKSITFYFLTTLIHRSRHTDASDSTSSYRPVALIM